MRRKRRIVIIAIVAAALLLLTLSALDTRLRVVSYTVSDARIETPVKIVLITDLHSCKYGEGQKTLLDAIDAQAPDLVLLCGDIFDDDLPNDNTMTVLRHVSERYRCFYVSGNHEYWYEDPEALFDAVRTLGIPILHGTCETVTVGQTTLNICGIADPACAEIELDENATEQRKAAREAVTAEQLQSAKDATEDGYYTILLAHRPELIETYAQYGFDLVVSGHAHGGQVRIPGLVNGLFSPGEQWFPKYAGGEYWVEETLLIVGRGLSREAIRHVPRIWNRPELVVIELLPADQQP
jgi:predicted MPP superfamily phosphohydrolase